MTRRQRFRAVVASTVGTTIEWYDTILFGLAVPLYIGPLFFPSRDPFTSALAGFSTLLASFIARPIGAALFGHYGDRLGRKATLVATLLVGGTASCAAGLVPTYAQIGVAAPILLVLLRVFIGASLGGEWGGSVLLSMEWSNSGRRGYWASWPQVGVPAATVLGFLALQGSLWLVGPSSYWAWRIPFLASVVLVAVGLYVRLGVLETPTFSRLLESRRVERRPVLAVLRRNRREVVLTCLLRLGEQSPALIFSTFFLVYATAALHLAPNVAIQISLVASLVGLCANPLFGYVSDLIGRRRMFLIGVVLMAAFALPYWALLDTRDAGMVLLASVVAQVIVAMMTGPQAAFIAESFTGSLRYTGASLGAGLGAVISGGLAGLIAIKLFQTFHSPVPIGLYIMACAAASFAAALALRERSRTDVSVEYDEQAAAALSQAATV
jgi:MFS family permease